MENGVKGKLRSTIPPMTAPAWASFRTGQNPGKHGAFDFHMKQAHTYQRKAMNSSDIDGKPLWSILSEADRKVIVINFPMTYPAEKVNGIMISGLLAPPGARWRKNAFFPPDLEETLKKELGDYRLEPKEGWVENLDSWIEDVYDVTKKRARAVLYLMKEYEWDFFAVVFQGTDWFAHSLWMYTDPEHPQYEPAKAKRYENAILEFYQEIDSIIGEILNQLDGNVTLFIMSDHGSGPLHKILHINYFLRELGLLKFKEASLENPARVEYWLSKVGLTKEKTLALLWGHPSLMKMVRWIWQNFQNRVELQIADVDWSRTKIYAAGHMGQLFINLKGREPEGIVEPEKEYEDLRNYLIEQLCSLKDPETGERIVQKVYRKEEIYSGKRTCEAPDILYVPKGPYVPYNGFEINCNSLVSPSFDIQSSKHEMDGIFIAKGKNIKKDAEVENASIVDLAPTMLHIIDVPIPSDMDGKVLKEIFEPTSELPEKKVIYQTVEEEKRSKYVLSDSEEKKMVERLRSLGYLG